MGAGEQPPHVLESGKSTQALSLAAQNKRIAAVSSRSSRLVRSCSCFAREWLRSYPLGRAFASRSCLWALARAPDWRRILHAFLVHLTESKVKISLEWAYLLWGMTHFYKVIAALRSVRHQWKCHREVHLSNRYHSQKVVESIDIAAKDP